MGQLQWTVSLVFVALFAISIIAFSLGFANDNSAPVSLASDSDINNLYSSATGNISGFNTGAEATTTSIINSSISEAGSTTQTAGQFSITPTNVLNIMFQTLRTGYTKIFGSGGGFGIVITTFIGLIVFITGLYIWKTWGGRNPD